MTMRTTAVAVVVVWTAACGLGPDEARGPVASAAQPLREPGGDLGIIIGNGLPSLEFEYNSLTTNDTARAALVALPLATASFGRSTPRPELYLATTEPAARKVLGYLVRCALGPEDSVTLDAAVDGGTLSGELGLCRGWATGAPDLHCQQLVSACMAALNNPLRLRVPLGLRGVDAALGSRLDAAAHLRGDTYRNRSSVEVDSFGGCTVQTEGVATNCGWERPHHVMGCVPDGRFVTVAGGNKNALTCAGPVYGSMDPGSDKVLRVCEGIAGCDSGGDGWLGQSESACSTLLPSVTFRCPPSGTFTVMERDYWVDPPPAGPRGTMTVGTDTGVVLPERAVLPLREGAFFGNLFTGPLGAQVVPYKGAPRITWRDSAKPVYGDLYACGAAAWKNRDAYLAARLCAADGLAQCISTHLAVSCEVACTAGVSATDPYQACHLPDGSLGPVALTTFLRAPCDVVDLQSSPACAR